MLIICPAAAWVGLYFESIPWHPPLTPLLLCLLAFTDATSNSKGAGGACAIASPTHPTTVKINTARFITTSARVRNTRKLESHPFGFDAGSVGALAAPEVTGIYTYQAASEHNKISVSKAWPDIKETVCGHQRGYALNHPNASARSLVRAVSAGIEAGPKVG
jgi:hypothetical protein